MRDRDLVWVVGDWRLDPAGRIDDRFDDPADMSRAGRLGNVITLNGRVADTIPVGANERLRLRLINAASARIFELELAGHRPTVLALDGQPVRQPADADRIVLAPGQRVDLLLDCLHPPGSRFDVLDHGEDAERSTRVAALRYGPARRPAPLREPVVLPANPLPAPDLAHAVRCPIVLGGGAMGQLTRARLEGEELDMAQLLARGRVWALNGVVGSNLYHFDAPLMRLRQGQTGLLSVVNETAWAHPVHLHGFPVVELTPEGQIGLWRDTVLLQPGARRPRFRGRAPRPVDVPLSHPRASGWRHDGIH